MSTPLKRSPHHYDHNINLTKNSHDSITHLQRTIGNQAVQQFMSSNAKGFDFAKISILQPRLKVSKSGDAYEQEADRVAEQVISMPMSDSIAPKNISKEQGIDRKCSTCEIVRKDKGNENLDISRKPSSTSNLKTTHEIANKINGIRSSDGLPLDPDIRRFMEPRIGHDFGNVRIHIDSNATESARSVGAQAYTVGSDIVFGSGQFLPHTPHGRRLLAHELTHVVQQSAGIVQGIQRQPGGGAQPAVLVPVQDPDAEEAALRAANPSLTIIDRDLQTSKQNEDAVQAVVLRAFGGEGGLNATFETLSKEVQDQVDGDSGEDFKTEKKAGKITDESVQKLNMKTLNRVQFFVRMRLYFNSWSDLLNHFKAIREFKFSAKLPANKKRVSIWLHDNAAKRLQRALEVLDNKGHKLPSITVGFGLRHRYRGEFQRHGMMTHAMGYAMDINAAKNPHLATEGEGGLEKNDLAQIAAVVGESHTYMHMDEELKKRGIKGNQRFIESMGKGEASEADKKTYFNVFEKEFEKMKAASIRLSTAVFGNNRDQLLNLRSSYFDLVEKLESKREELKKERNKKGSKNNPALIVSIEDSIKDLEAAQIKMLSDIPVLMSQWITAIDTKIDNELKKNGVDKLRPPSEISLELKAIEAEVKKARKEHAPLQSSKARAMAERDATRAVSERDMDREMRARIEAAKRHSKTSPEIDKASERAETSRQIASRKQDAVLDATKKEMEARKNLARVTNARDALDKELKTSNALKGLDDYRKMLAKPDLSDPKVLAKFELLTTGKRLKEVGKKPGELGKGASYRNPPLLRLLDKGFFSPEEAFDLDFFKEMARSGFWPGATWSNPDSMHFELVEGRGSIKEPGMIRKGKLVQ